MLKNSGYHGTYYDESISVSVLLENPLDCGLAPATLVFSIIAKDKQNRTADSVFEDCTFYIMDEQNYIYNTEKLPGAEPIIKTAADDDGPVSRPNGLLITDFRHEFLFQDLRIAFYYEPHQQFYIISLKH